MPVPRTIRKLKWLQENWDDGDVRALTMNGEGGVRGLSEKSIGDGVAALKKRHSGRASASLWNTTKFLRRRRGGGTSVHRHPIQKISPMNGMSLMERAIRLLSTSTEMESPCTQWGPLMPRATHITLLGTTNTRLANMYCWTSDKIMAEATGIDFRPSNGQLTPVGLLPRASQEERARQAGAY